MSTYKTREYYIARANEMSSKVFDLMISAPNFSSRRRMALVIGGTRDSIIAHLCAWDSNGCYTDEDHTAEFGKPSTLDNLIEIMMDQRTVGENLKHKTVKSLDAMYNGNGDMLDNALEFIVDCCVGIGMGYHPDDNFADYINRETNEKLFAPNVAKALQAYHDRTMKVLHKFDIDAAEIGNVVSVAFERWTYSARLVRGEKVYTK